MKYKLLQYRENLYSSYWLIPSILATVAIMLSFVTLYLDHRFSWPWLQSQNLIFTIGLNGAQVILSTIAGAIITVTSVTFSITVLTLSLASTQLGPRLLPNFMRQGITQFILGFFIATFIYCLLILRALSTVGSDISIPRLSIVLCILFGIVAFFMLIYFIHYVCHVIQIDTILDNLAKDLQQTIDRVLPNHQNNKKSNVQIAPEQPIKNHTPAPYDPAEITSDCSGYIQTIDYEKLVSIADKNDCFIKLHYQPGEFVFEHLPILSISKKANQSKKMICAILECFQIGMRRTSVQDIRFAFGQLVEVAIRALSSGVNDPNTTIGCLNKIAQGLSYLSQKPHITTVWHDSKATIRVVGKSMGYQKILASCFNRIRQYANQNLDVNLRILEIILDLLSINPNNALKQALLYHANLINHQCKGNDLFLPEDIDVIDHRYRQILEACQK